MRILISVANYLPHLTLVVALGATVVGILACPFESRTLALAFLYVSTATVACVFVTFLWHAFSMEPYRRILVMGYGVVPFILLWCTLLGMYNMELSVREANALTQMVNNSKNIGLGMHGFHDANNRLPADVRNDRDEALLSWRVSILPYVDQTPLYQQFDLAQPWNSPRNQPLVEKIPYVYPSITFGEEQGTTPWQGFVGPGTAFQPGRALRLQPDFPDGTSNTIFFVEAQQHVPWSKPGDIPYGPDMPLPALGHPRRVRANFPFPYCCYVQSSPRYLVCMADATVRMFQSDMPEEQLRALIVRNDGKGTLPDD